MDKYRLRQIGDATEILLYDEIGESWFGGVSAKQFREDVDAVKTDRIILRLNSPGGDALDGRAMYNTLKQSGHYVVAHVDGLAASAATMPMMAANELYMGRGAMIMIHNAWTVAAGDHHELRRVANLTEQVTEDLIPEYARYTGKTQDEIRSMLDAETWLNADQAIEEGFATGMSEDAIQVAAAVVHPKRYRNTPEHLISGKPIEQTFAKRNELSRKIRLTKSRLAIT